MPVYKGTLLFQNAGNNNQAAGFSESIQFEANDDDAARTSVAAWPPQRKKWLSHGWAIVGFRLSKSAVSEVSGKCKQKWTPIQIGACVGPAQGLLDDTDSPYAAVYFQVSFTDASKPARTYLARGIPDTWWSNERIQIPAGDGNKFLAWFNYMVGQKAGGYHWNPKKVPPCSATFFGWKQYCLKRIASRRIGRPFALLRGRRRKKPVT